MLFDKQFILTAISDAQVLYNNFKQDFNFSINTKTLKKGDIFVAIEGKNYDAHDFLLEVLEKGASGLIISQNKINKLNNLNKDLLKDKLIISVPDTYKGLIKLASLWRSQFSYPVIGVTGSVGKTSTKEILAKILIDNKINCLVSYGNQNTDIGISLNILKMRHEYQVAIFELGVNKKGEMAELAKLVRPTSAIITNIGHSHMEGLGSLVDIALEKRNIFKYFEENSIGFINGDQDVLSNVSYKHPVVKFGFKITNQIQARKILVTDNGIKCNLKIYKDKYPMSLHDNRKSYLQDVLAAVSVAHYLNIPKHKIIESIKDPVLLLERFEVKKIKNNKGILISDCYNANPESMKAALLNFQIKENSLPKIAILGDMLELGESSLFWHRQLGRFLNKVSNLEHLILVGEMVKWTKEVAPIGLKISLVSNWKEAISILKKDLISSKAVLVKGSNGIGLKNLVNYFVE